MLKNNDSEIKKAQTLLSNAIAEEKVRREHLKICLDKRTNLEQLVKKQYKCEVAALPQRKEKLEKEKDSLLQIVKKGIEVLNQ